MSQPPLSPRPYLPQQHVPYYGGPPAETFQPPPPKSRGPFVAAGVAGVAALTLGSALLVAAPWRHEANDVAAPPVRHTSPSAATQHPRHNEPAGPALDHTAVEKLLVDFENATAPVCNGGEDIGAKVGETFTCVEGSQKWTVRITEVEADGGIRYELVD